MPNLKTDRIAGMVPGFTALNVRRLMYQSLIWALYLRDHSCRVAAALDAQHLQCPADPLVDGVGGDAELDRYLLGGQMLVDEEQGVELALAQAGDSLCDFGTELERGQAVSPPLVPAVCKITLHQHGRLFTAKDQIKQSAGVPRPSPALV